MKKITILIVLLFTVANVFAQKGEKAIGASINYGSEIGSLGFGGHFYYNVTDHFRLAPDITYFLKNDHLNEWDVNLNVHYLFPIEDKLTIYPVAGFLITHWSADLAINVGGLSISAAETKFGINFGGGVQYNLTKTVFLKGELKYCFVSDFDQAVITAGIGFKF
ncbi:MAG: porin family protein [Dysgonamonadaceae bacterium]|jgi:outer membrane protein X|nr:porin family protein [Dysgonamonadaceae bacterium]